METKSKSIIDDIILATIGAMFMTRERAEQIFEGYIERWEEEKGSREMLIQDLISRSKEAHEKVEKALSDSMKDIVNKMSLARSEDVEKIEKELRRIERKLDKLTVKEQ